MRLIDADKLRKDIQFVLDTLGEPTQYGLRQAMSIVDRTPTVVVYCKDCKYWKKCIDEDYCSYWEEYCWTPAMADDFCSRGERKKPTEF